MKYNVARLQLFTCRPLDLTVRTDFTAGTEPRYVKSLVRSIHQRRRHGVKRNPSLPKEICHHFALQANLTELLDRLIFLFCCCCCCCPFSRQHIFGSFDSSKRVYFLFIYLAEYALIAIYIYVKQKYTEIVTDSMVVFVAQLPSSCGRYCRR